MSSKSARSTSLLLVTALVAVLALLLGGVARRGRGRDTTARRDAVPSDQPLPGYTISNPTLAPLAVDGRSTRVFQGVHQHAAYDVEVPADWNGELVMWAHGYRGTGKVLTVDTPGYGLRQKLLGEGYAWAASSYADQRLQRRDRRHHHPGPRGACRRPDRAAARAHLRRRRLHGRPRHRPLAGAVPEASTTARCRCAACSATRSCSTTS